MSPDDLARHVLALCELSAHRAQVARRRHLVANGCPADVVDGLNLSAENTSADEYDELPATWLREV